MDRLIIARVQKLRSYLQFKLAHAKYLTALHSVRGEVALTKKAQSTEKALNKLLTLHQTRPLSLKTFGQLSKDDLTHHMLIPKSEAQASALKKSHSLSVESLSAFFAVSPKSPSDIGRSTDVVSLVPRTRAGAIAQSDVSKYAQIRSDLASRVSRLPLSDDSQAQPNRLPSDTELEDYFNEDTILAAENVTEFKSSSELLNVLAPVGIELKDTVDGVRKLLAKVRNLKDLKAKLYMYYQLITSALELGTYQTDWDTLQEQLKVINSHIIAQTPPKALTSVLQTIQVQLAKTNQFSGKQTIKAAEDNQNEKDIFNGVASVAGSTGGVLGLASDVVNNIPFDALVSCSGIGLALSIGSAGLNIYDIHRYNKYQANYDSNMGKLSKNRSGNESSFGETFNTLKATSFKRTRWQSFKECFSPFRSSLKSKEQEYARAIESAENEVHSDIVNLSSSETVNKLEDQENIIKKLLFIDSAKKKLHAAKKARRARRRLKYAFYGVVAGALAVAATVVTGGAAAPILYGLAVGTGATSAIGTIYRNVRDGKKEDSELSDQQNKNKSQDTTLKMIRDASSFCSSDETNLDDYQFSAFAQSYAKGAAPEQCLAPMIMALRNKHLESALEKLCSSPDSQLSKDADGNYQLTLTSTLKHASPIDPVKLDFDYDTRTFSFSDAETDDVDRTFADAELRLLIAQLREAVNRSEADLSDIDFYHKNHRLKVGQLVNAEVAQRCVTEHTRG